MKQCEDCIYYELCQEDTTNKLCLFYCEDYQLKENEINDGSVWLESVEYRYTDTILTWNYDEYADGNWHEERR